MVLFLFFKALNVLFKREKKGKLKRGRKSAMKILKSERMWCVGGPIDQCGKGVVGYLSFIHKQ